MRVFTIAFIGYLTINPATAQEPAATGSLESQRVAAEESWQKATDAARSIAAAYREAAAAEPTDEQSIERLKSDLEAAVTKAFEAQTQLQSIRLQLAEENLERVRTKLRRREKLSDSIIARRAAQLQAGTRLTETSHKLEARPFQSPEALFAEWNRCYILGDAHGLVALLDDEAVDEFAATLLTFASHYATVNPERIAKDVRQKIASLLQTQRRAQPTAEARAAEALVFQQLYPRGIDDSLPNNMRREMATAAGVLVNPRAFCAEYLAIFLPVVRGGSLDDGLPAWQIDVIGDNATGTTESDFYSTSSTFEAIHHQAGWLIHSVYGSAAPSSSDPMLKTDDGQLIESPELHYFESPETLLDEWVRRSAGNNVADLVSLMDDNAATEFAAVMLFATASMSSVAQMAQMTGAAGVDPEIAQMLMIPAILERHKRDDPPAAAQLAYAQLSGVAVQVMFQGQVPDAKPPLPPKLLLQQLRTAVKILKEPRAFILELGPVFSAMSDVDQKAKSDLRWRIVNRSKDSVTVLVGDRNKPQKDAEMVLKKQDSGWLLHAYLSERTVGQLMPHSSSSTPPPTAPAVVVPAESVPMSSAVVPVDSFVVIRPIASGDRITWDNVAPVGSPAATPELVGALPKGNPYRDTRLRPHIGKYSSATLAAGDSITAEQMVSATPAELVELKMASGSSESLTQSWTDSSRLAFNMQFIDTIRSELPDWAGDYIVAVNVALSEANGEWTPQMVSMLSSLDSLIHVWQEDDDWDLHTTGRLLTEWTQTNTQNENEDINRAIHSARFLSRLARLTGEIPTAMLTARPLDPETAEKLSLLQTLVENNANRKWIGQEAGRLTGLLDEGPVPAVMTILRHGGTSDSDSTQELLKVIGLNHPQAENPYVSTTSTVVPVSTAPVDPVLLLSILARQAGKTDSIDQQTASILGRRLHQANFEIAQKLPGILDDCVDSILKGDQSYRTTVLRSLVGIYRKSSTNILKSVVSDMAPGVPVRAKAMDGDTLHLRDNHGNVVAGNMSAIPRDIETLVHHLRRSKRITVSSGQRNDSLRIEGKNNLLELAKRIHRIVHAEQIPVLVVSDEISALDGQLVVWAGSRAKRAMITLELLDVIGQTTKSATDSTDFSFDDDALYADEYTQIATDPASVMTALERADAIFLGDEYSAETYAYHGLSLESDLDRQALITAVQPLMDANNNVTLFASKDHLFIAAPQHTANRIAESIVTTIQENLPAKAAEQ